MEYIPEQWPQLRIKAGADEISSILDLLWEPGYQGLYENFLDWTDARIRGYLAGAGELKYVPLPGVGPYMPGYKWPATFVPSVWSTAKIMREQARKAFAGIIEEAIANDSSWAYLTGKLGLAWGLLEGSRHSEIEERLRTLSHTALGWYKHFARRYFMFMAPLTILLLKVWPAFIKPMIIRAIKTYAVKPFVGRFPQTARAIGYGIRPLFYTTHPVLSFKLAFQHVLPLARSFVNTIKGLTRVGIVPAVWGLKEILAVGLPAAGLLPAVVAALIATLLVDYECHAPGLSDMELDAIYLNPDLQPYREEAAQIAAEVHDLEQRISGLKVSIEAEAPLGLKPFSEQIMSDISDLRNQINRLRISIADETLDPVRAELFSRVERLGVKREPGYFTTEMKLETSLIGAEPTEEIIPDDVIDAYYDEGAILELLFPELERLTGDRDLDAMEEAELEEIVNRAIENSRPALEAYAEKLAGRILNEQQAWRVAEPATMALEAASEAAERLENLISLESMDRSEYERISQQLQAASAQLDPQDRDLAQEIVAATREIIEALI